MTMYSTSLSRLLLVLALGVFASGAALGASKAPEEPCTPNNETSRPIGDLDQLAAPAALVLAQNPANPDRCPTYKLHKDRFSFARNNPPASTIEGISFPRNERTLYRGTNASSSQFTATSTVLAMFGHHAGIVGSRYYSEVLSILQYARTLEGSPMRAQFEQSGIYNDIALLMACQKAKPFTKEEAALFAADLTDKTLANDAKREGVSRVYLDENSGVFQDWPSKIVYSSVHQTVAGWYGGKVLLFSNGGGRGIDHTYWEYRNRGRAFSNHFPADNGEYLTPGYIPPEDVSGYWIMARDERVFDLARQGAGYSPGIRWAFQKIQVGGQTFVAVLDGEDRMCIEQGMDLGFYSCRRNYPKPGEAGIKPYPEVEYDKPVPIVALIASCAPGAAKCAQVDDAFKRFPLKSRKALPDELWAEINAATAELPGAKVFLPGTSEPYRHEPAKKATCETKAQSLGWSSEYIMRVCDTNSTETAVNCVLGAGGWTWDSAATICRGANGKPSAPIDCWNYATNGGWTSEYALWTCTGAKTQNGPIACVHERVSKGADWNAAAANCRGR